MSVQQIRRHALEKIEVWTNDQLTELQGQARARVPPAYSSTADLEELLVFVRDAVKSTSQELAESVILELKPKTNKHLAKTGPAGSVADFDDENAPEEVLDEVEYKPSDFAPPPSASRSKSFLAGIGAGATPAVAIGLLTPEPFSKTWLATTAGAGLVGSGIGAGVYLWVDGQESDRAIRRLEESLDGYISEEMSSIQEWLEEQVVDEYLSRLSDFERRKGIATPTNERDDDQ